MERGGFKLFLLITCLLIIFSSFSVFAANETNGSGSQTTSTVTNLARGDLSKSYGWLHASISNTSSLSIEDRALSSIALLQNSQFQVSGSIENLKRLEDAASKCWPSGNCNVKDSSLATLALALSGQDVTGEVTWLKQAKVPMALVGEWWLVIKGSNGQCKITYPGGDKIFTLENDRIKNPSGSFTSGEYYINLNELSPTLVRTTLQPKITVSCDPSVGDSVVTLVYKPDRNTFFIQKSQSGLNLEFVVANACFGSNVPANRCDVDSTAYATWALNEISTINSDTSLRIEGLGTHIYLENQALNQRSNIELLGLLNRVLIASSSASPSFITELVKLQRPSDGSWNDNIFASSIALFGLYGTDKSDSVSRVINYLNSKVSNDGSWGSNIKSTSWALISLHGAQLSRNTVTFGSSSPGGADVEICGDGLDNDRDGVLECGELECRDNPICICDNGIKDAGEIAIDCGGTCGTCPADTGDDSLDVPLDDFTDDTTEPDTTSDPTTEEGGSLWWLWLLIILIVFGGGGFVFYTKYVKTGKVDLSKFFKKKNNNKPNFEQFKRQTEFKPVQPSPQPVKPFARPMKPTAPLKARPSKEEDELDKSIREAQRLLKG
ncbi:MAG TPA: hypothetical protein VJI68_03350 [Candidatus Nanoarchaeia archaeon]|nr:hypothetical protein [Candidatus Nanoarchaeia archaeon]